MFTPTTPLRCWHHFSQGLFSAEGKHSFFLAGSLITYVLSIEARARARASELANDKHVTHSLAFLSWFSHDCKLCVRMFICFLFSFRHSSVLSPSLCLSPKTNACAEGDYQTTTVCVSIYGQAGFSSQFSLSYFLHRLFFFSFPFSLPLPSSACLSVFSLTSSATS